jgi:hypothetical protein
VVRASVVSGCGSDIADGTLFLFFGGQQGGGMSAGIV